MFAGGKTCDFEEKLEKNMDRWEGVTVAWQLPLTHDMRCAENLYFYFFCQKKKLNRNVKNPYGKVKKKLKKFGPKKS